MAKQCINLQQSLGWCEGTPSYPGIRRRIYYIAKSFILKWPTLPKDENGRITASVYDGNFVLAADASWKYIDILPSKSQLKSDPQGEIPSQTQKNTLTAVHPGTGKEASAATAYLNNSDNVFLVPDMTGNYRVVGSELFEAVTTVTQDLGQGATGNAATTITCEATDVAPAPFYPGEIVTEDGVLMGDGSAAPDTGE